MSRRHRSPYPGAGQDADAQPFVLFVTNLITPGQLACQPSLQSEKGERDGPLFIGPVPGCVGYFGSCAGIDLTACPVESVVGVVFCAAGTSPITMGIAKARISVCTWVDILAVTPM